MFRVQSRTTLLGPSLNNPVAKKKRLITRQLTMLNKDKHVIIVGAGAWGLSTALHLARAGYTNISLFERSETIPSQYSAAYDLNKIIALDIRPTHESVNDKRNATQEAIKGWQTPLFGRYYHQTGYIVAVTGRAPAKATEHLEKTLASVQSLRLFRPGIRRLLGSKQFKEYLWQCSGPLTGFKGYYNRLAGYAHSSDTLKGIWDHVSSCGVRSVLGEGTGRVRRLLYDRNNNECIGVETADNKSHLADLVICALGSHGASLVPGLGKSAVARSWSVAHVQLTEDETNLLRGIPTTNVRDLGFFFEPDPKTRLFKLCPLGAGYTNTNEQGISLPPSDVQEFIPPADEQKLRQLLRETFPWMADRPFVDKKLCWFSDTRDSHYCIDFVPNTNNSVVCLSGDSGHGFKMMPIFGKWVVELLSRGEQSEPNWRWQSSRQEGQDWGEAVSWRIGKGAELKDLLEAQNHPVSAKL